MLTGKLSICMIVYAGIAVDADILHATIRIIYKASLRIEGNNPVFN